MDPQEILIRAQNALSEKFPRGIELQRGVSLSRILSIQADKNSDDEVLQAFLAEVSRHPKTFFRARPSRDTEAGSAKHTSSAPQDAVEDVGAISDRSSIQPREVIVI